MWKFREKHIYDILFIHIRRIKICFFFTFILDLINTYTNGTYESFSQMLLTLARSLEVSRDKKQSPENGNNSLFKWSHQFESISRPSFTPNVSILSYYIFLMPFYRPLNNSNFVKCHIDFVLFYFVWSRFGHNFAWLSLSQSNYALSSR